MFSHRTKVHGFTLLEVLVATVIVSLGLLGIASLQLANGLYGQSSADRTQASMLAQELFERMRVNYFEAKAGNYDIDTLPVLTTDCGGATADCTPDQMRDHDLRVWSARVSSLLPDADASISTGPNDGENPVDIVFTMSWEQNRGQDAAITETFTFQLMGLNQ
jgi:type IV pilus assembly protein PilV